MENFYHLRQAWVSLRKKPAFILTIVISLGLTLGALLSVITLFDQIIIKPLPYPDHDRLYRLATAPPQQVRKDLAPTNSHPVTEYINEHQDVFKEYASIFYALGSLNRLPDQPALSLNYATPEAFTMFSIPMALGRGFDQREAPGTQVPAAVLSYKAWHKYFNGRRDILHTQIEINEQQYQVIGVTAHDFYEAQIYSIGRDAEIWLPWDYREMRHSHTKWTYFSFNLVAFGNLKPGIKVAEAEEKLAQLITPIWKQRTHYKASTEAQRKKKLHVKLYPLDKSVLWHTEPSIYLLLMVTVGLLLIACLNITNLFMSRVCERRRQFSVHAAVGAKRGSIFSLLFFESVLILIFSSLLAIVIAYIGITLMQHYFYGVFPRLHELHLNLVSYASAIILAFVLAYFFALASSNMLNYKSLISVLNSGGKGTGIQISKKTRNIFIISQVALGLALIFINTTLLKSALESIYKPLGIEMQNRVNVELFPLSDTGFSTDTSLSKMQTIKEGLQNLKQVKSVSHSGPPHYGWNFVGHNFRKHHLHMTVEVNAVDNIYFSILGQQIIKGRGFTEQDITDRNKVIIINNTLANEVRKKTNSENLLGEIIHIGRQAYTIIGIAKSLEWPGANEIKNRSFLPVSTALKNIDARHANKFLVELKPGHVLSREDVVSIVTQTSDRLFVFLVEPLTVGKRNMLAREIAVAYIATILAILVFFCATIGLYGVLSYSIQLRKFELGTRMAVGATSKQLFSLILKENAIASSMGILLGTAIIVASSSIWNHINPQITGFELFASFMLTLISITSLILIACYWPLRKYTRRPAVFALRGE